MLDDDLVTVTEAWPYLLVAGGIVVWCIRLEGRVNIGDERHAKLREDLQKFYSPREETVALETGMANLTSQLVETKEALLRIENNVNRALLLLPRDPTR